MFCVSRPAIALVFTYLLASQVAWPQDECPAGTRETKSGCAATVDLKFGSCAQFAGLYSDVEKCQYTPRGSQFRKNYTPCSSGMRAYCEDYQKAYKSNPSGKRRLVQLELGKSVAKKQKKLTVDKESLEAIANPNKALRKITQSLSGDQGCQTFPPTSNPDGTNPQSGYRYPSPDQTSHSLEPERFGACLARVAKSEFPNGLTSDLGEMKCKAFSGKDNDGKACSDASQTMWQALGCAPTLVGVSFQLYISAGQCRPFEYYTGTEEQLKSWVLNPATKTPISPVALFRRALQLNNGNIWNAALACHQLTRNQARWFDKFRYDANSDPADEKAFWDRFADIRGDLKERGGRFVGDHAGTWYRIWAVMLSTFYADSFENNYPRSFRQTPKVVAPPIPVPKDVEQQQRESLKRGDDNLVNIPLDGLIWLTDMPVGRGSSTKPNGVIEQDDSRKQQYSLDSRVATSEMLYYLTTPLADDPDLNCEDPKTYLLDLPETGVKY